MVRLKINQEKINNEIAEKLIKICPFNAIEYNNGQLDINAGCKMCKICVKKGPKGAIEFIEDEIIEVDKIFGKEAREIIGPEQRDPAAIDRYDTTRFARLGHEVPFGMDISQFEPETPISYEEEGGNTLVKRLKPEESVVLKRRR